jgi:hypothetical protein
MVGQLINKFENLPHQTVRQFNKIFKYKIEDANDDHEVEILDLVNDGVRKIVVNGEMRYQSFKNEKLKKKDRPSSANEASMYAIRTKGKKDKLLNKKMAASYFKLTVRQFEWVAKLGKYKDYKIVKVKLDTASHY